MNRKIIYLLGLGIVGLKLYNSQIKGSDNKIKRPNEYLEIEQRIKDLSNKTKQLQNKVNEQLQSLNP